MEAQSSSRSSLLAGISFALAVVPMIAFLLAYLAALPCKLIVGIFLSIPILGGVSIVLGIVSLVMKRTAKPNWNAILGITLSVTIGLIWINLYTITTASGGMSC